MPVHCLQSGCIGLYIPYNLEISLGIRDVTWSSASGHLSVIGDVLYAVLLECHPEHGLDLTEVLPSISALSHLRLGESKPDC